MFEEIKHLAAKTGFSQGTARRGCWNALQSELLGEIDETFATAVGKVINFFAVDRALAFWQGGR